MSTSSASQIGSQPIRSPPLGFASSQKRLIYRHLEVADHRGGRKLDQFCDQAGPSDLVAGTQTRAIIAMEVLVEQYVILQWGLAWNFSVPPVNRSPARFIPQKDSVRRLAISLATLNRFISLPASRTLYLEVVAVKEIERQ